MRRRLDARATALGLSALVVVYLVLLAGRGVALLGAGTAAGVGLGVGVLLLPVVGLWIALANLRFGVRVQRLAERLAAEGGLPDISGLPRRPSGRVDRAAADRYFERVRAEAQRHPRDWRGWYRLAHAYDVAGDRRRARETMRHALELAGSEHSGPAERSEPEPAAGSERDVQHQRGGEGQHREPDEPAGHARHEEGRQ